MADDPGKRSPRTLTAQGMGRVAPPHGDVVPPIHVSTTYERAGDGSYPGGRVYSRADNPTYDAPEAVLAALEGAAGALLFASGQAAAQAIFQALAPGDRVLAPRNMYWGLRNWLTGPMAAWGLSVELYENASLDDLRARVLAAPTRLVWIETPANPTWDITDIAAASAIAKEGGAAVAVDSTCATPVLTQPIALGADLVMHSA
ncbi:MAG TPA: PLP-dependent transferase, partial [Usitatibacter sp.]|nr:PLP-dependent transferase [Usitatibacter sp.]